MAINSSTGLPILSGQSTLGADPVCPDGISLSQHLNMLIRGFQHLTDDQVRALVSGAKRRMPALFEDMINVSESNETTVLQNIDTNLSLNEELAETVDILKESKQALKYQTEQMSATDKIRVVNAINNALNRIRKLLPEISSSESMFKLQKAMSNYANTLAPDEKEAFLVELESALVETL